MKTRQKNKNKYSKKSVETTNSYEEVQTRKLISSYGGVGSIIETRDGAIIIEPFNEWNFFKDFNLYGNSDNWINDKRFIHRLKSWFSNLIALVQLPENDLKDNGHPERSAETISAKYFPEWMFCPQCKRFDKFENWHKHWQNSKTVMEKDKNKFFPPKCHVCYSDAIRDKKEKYRLVDLEQIRFVMTSPSGSIVDVPWDRWVFAEIKGDKTDETQNFYNEDVFDEEKRKFLNFEKDIPQDVFYKYEVSDQYNNLKGINIVAHDISDEMRIRGRNSLEGIFSLRIRERDVIDGSFTNSWMKVVIRSSNSIYYPNILESLFLPVSEKLDDFSVEAIEFIKKQSLRNKTVEAISENLEDAKNIKRTPEQIQKLIDNNYLIESNLYSTTNKEEDYRLSEYKFIVSQNKVYKNEDANLHLEPIDNKLFAIDNIKNIYRIDSLKMTSVQVSFTRQEPTDKDFYLQADSDEIRTKEGQKLRKKYTSIFGNRTKYIPAISNLGEGIFIDFDNESIDNWVKSHSEVQKRANILQENFDNTKLNENEERNISAKLVLLHTFSHQIIKELEFLSGYPATSLKERLYVGDDMQGVLIYTIAGAEGSYGGLVSTCKSNRIAEIIKSALFRAKDCASDPICYQTNEQGQGVGGTNLAACYSCALLPETSCEEFNRFLDRRLLIDPTFGYFKELLK